MEPTSTIAIVGAGSLGQAFAGLLAANGRAVTLLATESSSKRLLGVGAIRLRGGIVSDIPVCAVPAPARVGGVPFDPTKLPADAGLIFATKGHQLDAAVAT